jgi:glycosyltransferase involved in cell wall biosynthesis
LRYRLRKLGAEIQIAVNHFNTYPYGGAASAARRLHVEMINQGAASRFVYAISDRAPPADPTMLQMGAAQTAMNRWKFAHFLEKRRKQKICHLYDRHIAARRAGAETFSMAELSPPPGFDWDKHPADIAHLHWVAFMADYPSFFRSMPRHIPIIWTLHDMSAFTGGCHYSGGCDRFKSGCGNCPQVHRSSHRDVSAAGFRVKRRSLRGRQLTVVSPSHWLCQLAKQSVVWPDRTTFHVIRLGFDLNELRPAEKTDAKAQFGMNGDSVTIGFGADDIQNRRKGFDLLASALSQIDTHTNLECLVLGGGANATCESELVRRNGRLRMRPVGYLSCQKEIAQFFSACDLVVVPSREDNSPQIGLEAMACGTPVVAFNVGGISEYVIDGVTGLTANPNDSADLARKIRTLVEDRELRRRFAERGLERIRSEYEIGLQTRKYLHLYQGALNRLPAGRVA